jgi:GTP-binding protein
LDFITWLGENGVPFGIIFTKVDKLSKAKVDENVQAFLDTLREEWEELPPYFLSSAEKGTGKEEILGYIEEINKSLS